MLLFVSIFGKIGVKLNTKSVLLLKIKRTFIPTPNQNITNYEENTTLSRNVRRGYLLVHQ